ncbi:biotin--[acetyl-CoA-carboxylase] ligase [Legionella londiniensis]|uniref:Bifunctional ligase/repressor BirA n=1 Tax=Legionella londiniensis TaxID=45068 RepID=A0A0W0VKL8_9GAMM|nr:biotin--[acetyl-CoA-carboxylase] ligase [Legionella londiniensis]KTD20658.1 biotin-[acetylCoA carboxylase] holoenzyme synthetase and biotin operon repressor [Legionella londiniensis]STX92871.1 biotin-[acetylCoA carboxylase] holoenzyme synthetase and biotin operon repressor [Legionella londiniensis]
MKQFNDKQIKILNELARGECKSGEEIGQALGITRTAVWKQIRQLSDMGVPIESRPQKGYQLRAPVMLLDEQHILANLKSTSIAKDLCFHLFASIDSTNRFLKNLPKDRFIHVCCAEMQTDGRGRFGRQWLSPFGDNIYCSSRWHFSCDPLQLSGLSLVVSLAVHSALKSLNFHTDIQIKWPNDLLWQNRKLSGCLIEISAESHGETDVVIGIGLNVNSTGILDKMLDKPWCSLYDITSIRQNRNVIIAKLILSLQEYLQRFSLLGFKAFLEEWNDLDYLKNQSVMVHHHSDSVSGIAMGVNELGQLMLMSDKGEMLYLTSGDTTMSF